MGKLLSNYKKTMVDSFIYSVEAEKNLLFGFAGNTSNTSNISGSVLSTLTEPQYDIQFGKRIFSEDIAPVIKNILWQYGQVYDMYDNIDDTLFEKNFYVVTTPVVTGGYYHIFKCIDNNRGGISTQKPALIQLDHFTTSDNYTWKYLYSISTQDYNKFATDSYIPVTANNVVVNAADNSGIDSIIIENSGVNYTTIHQGVVRSVLGTNILQIDLSASTDNDFYKDSSIYMTTGTSQMGQLLKISQYIANTSGKWVLTSNPVNTSIVYPGLTEYTIQPTLEIVGNGIVNAKAYPVVANNQISSVVIIDRGKGYTHATARIIANTSYGANAEIRAITPPPGGHGANIEAELNVTGLSVNFTFDGAEGNIQDDNVYSVVGILRNPVTAANSSLIHHGNTFVQLLKGTLSPLTQFTNNDIVVGETSLSSGKVFFANTSTIHLTGDKNFANNEIIKSLSSNTSANITINNRGDINSKNLDILYTQSVNQIQRTSTQKETYKIIIQV